MARKLATLLRRVRQLVQANLVPHPSTVQNRSRSKTVGKLQACGLTQSRAGHVRVSSVRGVSVPA